jgi:hypothetical protein
MAFIALIGVAEELFYRCVGDYSRELIDCVGVTLLGSRVPFTSQRPLKASVWIRLPQLTRQLIKAISFMGCQPILHAEDLLIGLLHLTFPRWKVDSCERLEGQVSS